MYMYLYMQHLFIRCMQRIKSSHDGPTEAKPENNIILLENLAVP